LTRVASYKIESVLFESLFVGVDKLLSLPIIHISLNQWCDRELHFFLSMVFLWKEYSRSIDRETQLKHKSREFRTRTAMSSRTRYVYVIISRSVPDHDGSGTCKRSHNICTKPLAFTENDLYFDRVYVGNWLASRRRNKNFAWIYENRRYWKNSNIQFIKISMWYPK